MRRRSVSGTSSSVEPDDGEQDLSAEIQATFAELSSGLAFRGPVQEGDFSHALPRNTRLQISKRVCHSHKV